MKKHFNVLTEKTKPQTTFNNKKDWDNKFKKNNNNNEGSHVEKKREYKFNTKSNTPKISWSQVYQQNSSSGGKYKPNPDISVYGPINTGGFNPPYTFGNYGIPYPLMKPFNPNIVKKYVIDNSMLGSKDIDTLFENVVPTEMLILGKCQNV